MIRLFDSVHSQSCVVDFRYLLVGLLELGMTNWLPNSSAETRVMKTLRLLHQQIAEWDTM